MEKTQIIDDEEDFVYYTDTTCVKVSKNTNLMEI